MRVLIVGWGYVGSVLGEQLAADGHEVTGVCRRVPAARQARRPAVRLVAGDLTREDGLADVPVEVDWVVLCAASGGGGVAGYRALYVEGTRRLLRRFEGRPLKRFVYTGSTGVYGQADGSPVDEDSPTEPSHPTGQILVEAEAAIQAAANHGLPAVILRLAGIYGPDRGYWLKQFLAGAAKLEGDGGRYLNMIHRDDVVRAVRAALEQGRPGRVYNVVDDEPVTQREVFAWLAERLGRPLPPAVADGSSAGGKGRPGSKRVSNRRLREELGVTLAYPTFREGFAAELARRRGG